MALLYVQIPCPSGKHGQSVVTFRHPSVAVLFCEPCGESWEMPVTHPALRDLPLSGLPSRQSSGES